MTIGTNAPVDVQSNRWTIIAGAVLVTVIAILVCLRPKPENDLFFEIRIGSDILQSGHLPHFDTYSWINRGMRWDVPEWLSFVLFAHAFRLGGFFGTWLMLIVLTAATAWIVWFWLVQRTRPAPALLLTILMLLAMSDCLQERPYAFSYLLLAVSLMILTHARGGRPRLLLWLVPLCVLWTNLHQGVVVLICLLLAYGMGDAVTAAWLRRQETGTAAPDLLTATGREWAQGSEQRAAKWRCYRSHAGLMLGTAAACFAAGMVSPYGWRVYWNVFITLRDPILMANVTEWNSVATLPLTQLQPFLALALIAVGTLALTSRRTFADIVAVAALFGEALLHARNIPLFAIGSLVIITPHFDSAATQAHRLLGLSPKSTMRHRLLTALALMLTAATAVVSLTHLQREIGPNGYSLAGMGEAVAQEATYPENACAFMDAEGFPPHLRLLNDFETGGYLLWRLPREPVFIDGRLDVYVGRTFNDMLTLSRVPGSPAWAALVQQYDFNCVLTASRQEANAFAASPQWKLVYSDPPGRAKQHYHILLRRRPEFAGLIAHCLRDRENAQAAIRPK